jgi:hypothetical protein
MKRLAIVMIGCAHAATPAPPDPIPLAVAARDFAEASAACARDAGALWGVSLCGPMMLADPKTRFVVANRADARGLLRARGGVFVGTLPAEVNIANTAVEWAGVRWTQIAWPLPDDADARGALMLHELFHRIQDTIGFPATAAGADNAHLATLDGRYHLVLELRALARALRATDDAERRAAIADALAFRAARGAGASEDALEMNEGLAEYTGDVVGSADPLATALGDVETHARDRSFVRSFAYATGPAYGLLLDRHAAGWRAHLRDTRSLATLLATALAIAPDRDVERRAAGYDGPALRAAETERAAQQDAARARYRSVLVEGPVLTLAFQHMSIQFDPNEVETLGDAGSLYPHLRVTDAWGVLEAKRGALVGPTWNAVVVAAPASTSGRRIAGDGWTLELAPGWRVVADDRPGSFRVTNE